MSALEELKFRQRIKHLKPKYCELMPIGQEHRNSYCIFCSQTAEYWLNRVYSFGGNSEFVVIVVNNGNLRRVVKLVVVAYVVLLAG